MKKTITNHKKVFIVLPAKDEGKRIGRVLQETLSLGYTNIIVVNDGSMDNTEKISKEYGATVINHAVNLGAGAATQTGIQFAVEQGADIVVTMDADHQHHPSDIKQLVTEMENKEADLVIGSRFLNTANNIPIHRQYYNKVGNLITLFFTGLKVSDSQSGMKAMRADFIQKTHLHSAGYEFCIEIIRNAKKYNATISEVPIKVTYSKETLEKGQNFFNGFKMVFNLFKLANRYSN